MCKVAWSDAAREGVVVEHGAMGEGEIVQRGDGIYVRDNLPGLDSPDRACSRCGCEASAVVPTQHGFVRDALILGWICITFF